MPVIDDTGVASSIEGSMEVSGDVPQAVVDHIQEVFSNADAAEMEGPGEETVSVPPKELARRAAVKQEQEDELVQEGLEDPNNPDGDKAAEKEVGEDGAPEDTAQEPAEENAATEPTLPLDPNLRFVAQFYGFNDEQIDKLYKADPELATQTFENFLNAFQAQSRQGGLLPAQQSPQQTPAAPQPQAQARESKIDAIVKNLKEFSEVNGEPLGDFVKSLHDEVIVPFRQMQAELVVQKQQAVAAEASLVTNSLSEKFPEVYGKGEKLNLLEQTNRQKLYEVADQIRAGAYQQGKEMSVKDALSRAHLIVTADKLVASGRKQVQQQVQRRAKQITAKPTQRVKPGSPGVAKGESTAAEAYSRRASELGIDIGE